MIFHVQCESRQQWTGFFKMLLIMKITALILLVTCIQVYASTSAQTVTLSLKDASVNKVLKEINRQTGYQFFYKDALLKKAGKITLDLKNATIEQALERCFADVPVKWAIENDAIVIETVAPPVKVSSQSVLIPAIPVMGKVVDEKGATIPGVNIVIKGTQSGTVTDVNGEFSIEVPDSKAVLVFSFIGYESQEFVVGTQRYLKVVLKAKVSEIDEVQVIAYGTTTKRMSTGTVATIKGDKLQTRPANNIMQAIQGQLPGVSVTTMSPGIGSPLMTLIRGVNSISSGIDPLIIVDGVIINQSRGGLGHNEWGEEGGGSNTYQQGVSPLNFINPNDIESIDILKDADATAIYGSRGTNGVILITTKKASLGVTKYSINVSTGWKSPTGLTERMNTQEYLKMRKDAFAVGNIKGTGAIGADGNPDPAGYTSVINPITPTAFDAPDLLVWNQDAYTDWTKFELGQPAPSYNIDGTMSGGTNVMNYLAGISYLKNYDTYFYNPYQERINGRMQLNSTSANKKFKLSMGAIFGIENQKFSQTNMFNVNAQACVNVPNYQPYVTPDGKYSSNQSDNGVENALYVPYGQYRSGMYYNPLLMKNVDVFSKTSNVLLNSDISYLVFKGLTAKVQFSYNNQTNKFHRIFPSTAMSAQTNWFFPYPSGVHNTTTYTSLNIEPQLIYTADFSKLNVSALVGSTFLDRKTDYSGITINNPGSDDLLYNWGSANPPSVASAKTYNRFNSVFARGTFSWDQKYLANLTWRRDGSSRFGPENRFANFYSAGFGWIFTQENFVKNSVSFLSYGKIRGSYGTTGNDNIADYQYLSLLQAGAGDIGYPNALDPATFPNRYIEWEQTTKRDFGLELGFFDNRVLLNTTVYRTIATNLLTELPLPGQTGYGTYTGNFQGLVQNTGIELDLTTHNLSPKSALGWTTKFNFTNNKNILKSFPDLESSSYATTLQVGRALVNSDYLLSILEMPGLFKGIDPASGLPLFEDTNKDGILSYEDFGNNDSWIGSATPSFWGGMTNSFTYKGFALDIFAQFSNGIFTNSMFYMGANGVMSNPPKELAGNYWMQPGDDAKYPRLYSGVSSGATMAYLSQLRSYYQYSTATIFKSYYIRLKNVQLSYTLPQTVLSKLKVDNLMIYVNGENLAVYCPVKLGKDPEVFWSRSNSLYRVITTGVRLTF